MQGGAFVLSSPPPARSEGRFCDGTVPRQPLRRRRNRPSYPRLSMLPISGLIRTRSSRMRFSEVVSFASGGDEPFTSSGTNWVCVFGRYVSAPGVAPDLLFVFVSIVSVFRNSVRLPRFSGPDTPESTTFVPDSAGQDDGTGDPDSPKTFGSKCTTPFGHIM